MITDAEILKSPAFIVAAVHNLTRLAPVTDVTNGIANRERRVGPLLLMSGNHEAVGEIYLGVVHDAVGVVGGFAYVPARKAYSVVNLKEPDAWVPLLRAELLAIDADAALPPGPRSIH